MTNSKSGPVTAEEFLNELRTNQSFNADVETREREFLERKAVVREAEKPLINALGEVGIRVETVWDLVSSKPTYAPAIPILLEHLRKPYPDVVLEGIARALAIRQAKLAWPALVAAYKAFDEKANPQAKDGVAVALYVISDETVVDEVIELICDPENGESRILLLERLKKSKAEVAHKTIERLRSDPVFSREINSWRKKK